MSAVFTLAARELRSYFDLPIAYVVLPAFLALAAAYQFVLDPFFLNDQATLRPLFEFTPFIFTLFAPALTMRALAEERRSGMIEVLLAWPISDWSLVLGKFLGALGLLATAIALTLPAALSVAAVGPLDWGPVLGGYLGLILLGAANLAIGLAVSALASNQIAAFIGGFLACFVMYALGQVAAVCPPDVAIVVERLGFQARFAPIARGVLDVRDVTYFVAITFVCLGLTAEQIGRRRWRR